MVRRYDYKFYTINYITTESNYDKYLNKVDKSTGTFAFAERLTIDADPRVTSVTLDTRSYLPKDLPKTTVIAIGQACTLSVEREVAGSSGTRYVFVKWSDGVKEYSRKITITQAESFRAEYKTQHLLTVESEYGTAQGGGWYDSGTTATFSVSSPVPISGFMGSLGAKMVFDRWSGDSAAPKESHSIVIDSPKKVIALWREDYTQAYMILGLAGAAIIVLASVLLMKTRKGAPASQP